MRERRIFEKLDDMRKETEKLLASNNRRELLAAATRAESAVGAILRRLGLRYIVNDNVKVYQIII